MLIKYIYFYLQLFHIIITYCRALGSHGHENQGKILQLKHVHPGKCFGRLYEIIKSSLYNDETKEGCVPKVSKMQDFVA